MFATRFGLPAPWPSPWETALWSVEHLARMYSVYEQEGDEHGQRIETQLVSLVSQDGVR